MKRSILALASGAFVLGAAEFVMMGILPFAAHDMHVTIPQAGWFITLYATGVCLGALILVFGRKLSPKNLIIFFMVLVLIGNAMAALAPNAAVLLIARFISGLPHGAFFGTATLAAKMLADPGKEAQSVALMVTGQTFANMVGVPAGTMLGEVISWRYAFAILAAWGVMTMVLVAAWVPYLTPVEDKGLAGQFKFLAKPGPWMILAAVLLGNTGIFCWWSYVSPWLTHIGGYQSAHVPWLMMLAGFGMVVGGLIGGKICDAWRHAGTAALGQAIATTGLIVIALIPGSRLLCAVLTLWLAFGMFFISSPQQLLMAEAGKGGGELIGGASVQIAFNAGNALGSALGGLALNASGMNYHIPALTGVPISALAVLSLLVFTLKYETQTDAASRMREIHV